MKHRDECGFYLWRCAMPNLLGALYLFARMAFFENLREPSVLIALSLYAAAAMAVLALAVRALVKKALPLREPMLAAAVSLLSILAAWRVYEVPMPAQLFKQEFVLLLFAGFSFMSAGQLVCEKTTRMAPKDVRHVFVYGALIPFFLTFLLMAEYMTHVFSTLALGGIAALFCLGAVFLILSITLRNRAPEAEADEADGAADGEIKRKRPFKPYLSPAMVMLFGILFPVAGLVLNESLGGMIGDFSSPWYYILAIVNGLAMFISAFRYRKHVDSGLPLFFVKAIGVVFVLYFALIFIPAMPIGVAGLLGGVGVLFLTPSTLLALEITQLVVDAKALRLGAQWRLAAAAMAVGFALLPVMLAGNALMDRVNFYRALEAVSSEGGENRPVDANRLSRTLTWMSDSARASASALEGSYIENFFANGYGKNLPMLSLLYSEIAYSNEPLAKNTVERLLSAYFPPGNSNMPDVSAWGIEGSGGFRILSHRTHTTRDESGAYRTWVDLEIKSDHTNAGGRFNRGGFLEFSTEFSLPRDCFVTDYYLFVGLEKKQGLLSEKSAADQIYESIVNRRQDPGKLCYTAADRLELRVYPFTAGEVRKTGFELLHAAPLTIIIGGEAIDIGTEGNEALSVRAAEILSDSGDGALPYEGNAYLDAAVLMRNTELQGEGFDAVVQSFRHQVLTPRTCFIALETLSQENALKFLQTQIMSGETDAKLLDMDEPWPALLLSLLLVALILFRRYNNSWQIMRKR